jgi:hypothetical protein
MTTENMIDPGNATLHFNRIKLSHVLKPKAHLPKESFDKYFRDFENEDGTN